MADIKLPDEAFLAILRENGGLYARTAKAIEEQYGTKYSRQAVRQRALDHPDEIKDIDEEVADSAEEGLQTLMKDTDARIKIDAIKFYLKTKAKHRGYIERQEFTGKDGEPILGFNYIAPKE
jgi:hypothetical protein